MVGSGPSIQYQPPAQEFTTPEHLLGNFSEVGVWNNIILVK